MWVTAGVLVGNPHAAPLAAALTTALLVAVIAGASWMQTHSRCGTDKVGAVSGVAIVVLAAVMLIATVVAVRAEHRVPTALQEASERSGRVQLRVTTSSLARESGTSTLLRATTTEIDGHPASAPVLLFLPAGVNAPAIGTEIELEASLKLLPPGDRVVALAFVEGELTERAPPHPLLTLGDGLRTKFLDLAQGLPEPGASLVPGLAVGDERLVDGELEAAMKVSSLTHLTAVSGSNIALITVAFIAIGRLAGWPRVLRIAIAGVAVSAFVLLVTPQGSVIRAAAMAAVVLVLEASARPVSGVPVLALAVIVLLVADPWLARDYGFALSAAATAGLLLGTRPATRILERWLPTPIAALIAVPTVAQLACQPILLLLEPTLPTYGVLANLLAAPAAPIATVVGLLACVLAPFAEPLASVLVWIAWLPAHWIGLVAETSSAWPLASIPWLPGAAGALVMLLATAAVWFLLAHPPESPRHRGVRNTVGALLTIALAVAVTLSAARMATMRRDLPYDWRVVACDVGQGDALLLRAGGLTALVDTGDDIELLHECLDQFEVQRIDLFIASHFDRDHTGALEQLRVPITAAWLPDTEQARLEPDTQRLQTAGVAVHFAGTGDRAQFGDLTLTTLWPQRRADGSPSREQDNDSSLVVSAVAASDCETQCFSTVFLGDAGERIQQRVASRFPQLRADVVKVSHHGSADQSADLYRQLSSRLALISVGDNDYGHPTKGALEALRASNTPWLRTDERGHIAVFETGGELSVWASKPAPSAASRQRTRRIHPALNGDVRR